ncbi:MAG: hypothetical protein LAQ69_19590 [Acidobacteriia bacterium]|nr:hypothetical protein [Terriglobia bacterium]
MATSWANLRREFHPMLRLAAPLALAELGWAAKMEQYLCIDKVLVNDYARMKGTSEH